jgi:cysteinyl-tRNA synthetase
MGALGVLQPDFEPRATAFIPRMIEMIEHLIAEGHAYEAEGHVLFSVRSDPDYGVLSRRDREQMIAGARVEVAPYKRDPADFVLWKPAGTSAEQVALSFESPWGRGRPGWHIECSAMIEAFGNSRGVGNTIDIHGGGLDLIFPHHENEIAQSSCAHHAPLANYWVHNGFVDMGAEKMSKSLGNIVTPAELLEQGYSGEALRLALLSAHYRQPLSWEPRLIRKAEDLLKKASDALRFVERLWEIPVEDRFLNLLRDDLNTGVAIDYLWSKVRKVRASADMESFVGPIKLYEHEASQLVRSFELLGISRTALLPKQAEEDSRIQHLVVQRAVAKKNGDFATADRIRDELKAEGIILEDGPGGTTWRRE